MPRQFLIVTLLITFASGCEQNQTQESEPARTAETYAAGLEQNHRHSLFGEVQCTRQTGVTRADNQYISLQAFLQAFGGRRGDCAGAPEGVFVGVLRKRFRHFVSTSDL